MNKILLIIKREYLTRVRKKSFVIMTIVGPLLMAAVVIIPIWLTQVEKDVQYINVIDETGLFINKIPETQSIKFHYSSSSGLQKEKEKFYDEDYTALLYIPRTVVTTSQGIQLYYKKQPGITTLKFLEKAIESEIESGKLAASGIDKKILESIKTNVRIITIGLDESGSEEKSYTEVNMIVGLFSGILIYFFIFMYGSMVMRGVIEEKTSRIVEIIISSVKPFQLMMGKIVGVALVGLTQFLLWIVFTFIIVAFVTTAILPDSIDRAQLGQTLSSVSVQTGEDITDSVSPGQINEVLDAILAINFGVMISAFLFFFPGGLFAI